MEVGCERYWGQLNPDRDDHWVFGDKHTGEYLLKFSWFKIDQTRTGARHSFPRRPGFTGLLVGKGKR